jgi:phosphoglycerol transferase MdoB-like AlkP superfamily enzyme
VMLRLNFTKLKIPRQRIFLGVKQSLPPAGMILALALLPIGIQYLHLLDFKDVRHWLEVFTDPYKVNTAIVMLLFLCLYVLFNSAFFALSAVTVFCLLFGIVDMQKMRVLHQPLLPSDLFFFKQALLIAEIYFTQALAGCLALGAVVAGTVLLRKRVPHYRLPRLPRLIAAIALCATVALLVRNFHSVVAATGKRLKIVNESWDQLSNFRKNGVLYGFLLNIESLKITRPPHYGKKAIDRILFYDSTTVELPGRPPAKTPSVNTDVIIYMNESFWDITKITTVKPQRDPIPVFHAIGKRNGKINLISPTFGGNTCLAEFEILTGMSHGYFPPGSVAYNQYIKRPVPSMVRVFKENGYRTVAIHTFKRWFWNRDNVYRHFGFDEFISDDSMEQEPRKGTYISDETLARHIIRHAASQKGPIFIFAISMQNHGHYSYKRYDSLDCPVATGLSATAELEYNSYLQGIIDADKSLKQIVDYVKKATKPTIMFFFGDHLPGFTNLYDETGYRQAMDRDTIKAYTQTAVWYANFKPPAIKDTVISMVFLPLLVARETGIEIPLYYRFLDGIKSRYPVFTPAGRLDTAGCPVSSTEETKAEDEACRMILYDAIFGKQYAERHHHLPEAPDGTSSFNRRKYLP